LEDTIDLHRPRLGQFLLTWMKESELRQAKNTLEEQCDRRYETAIKAVGNELAKKEGEDEGTKHGSSWLVMFCFFFFFFYFFFFFFFSSSTSLADDMLL
jgi:ABC-type Na+ efflux pump permease subunit